MMTSKDSKIYESVFDEYRKSWKYAEKVAEQFGPLPKLIHINQSSEYDSEKSHCIGEVLKSWSFDGKLFQKTGVKSLKSLTLGGSENKVFFDIAYGCFYISPNSTLVVMEYFFGPRFGQGIVYRVEKGKFIDEGLGWKS